MFLLYTHAQVMLQSMHKYMVRILISETGKDVNATVPKTFTFPETTFMAVTAYQNNHITKLKIHNNPFAKAFRDKHIGRYVMSFYVFFYLLTAF